jgi:ADP-heptose:LPS heptosyltransferase
MRRHYGDIDGAMKRALVIRFGGIGDNLIASSVLPVLARDYAVDVMAQIPQSCVFENNPHVTRLITKKEGELPSGDNGNQWHAWIRDRGAEYDFSVNLSHSCETKLALFRNECAFWWPQEMRRKLCGQNYLEFVHDICGMPHDFEPGPRFYPTELEQKRAQQTIDMIKGNGGYWSVVGIPISGSRLDKIWPYLPMLVARLLQDLRVAVVLFGASDRDLKIAQHTQDFVKLWCGSLDGLHAAISPDPKEPSWPIRRAMATLQQCDLVLSPDTGLAWSVAMEPMPKVVLLSHASAHNITDHWVNTTSLHADAERVPCYPCHRLHDDASTCVKADDAEASKCMADITLDAVFNAVRDNLKGQIPWLALHRTA